jgi:hypothetical protein
MYTKYLRSNLPDEINTNVQEKDVDTWTGNLFKLLIIAQDKSFPVTKGVIIM